MFTTHSAPEDGLVASTRRRLSRAALALAQYVHIIVSSVHPDETNAWQVAAQLRLYRRSTRNSTLLIPIAGFLVALGVAPWIPAMKRTVWWLCLSVLCVALDVACRRLDAKPMQSLSAIRARARAYTGMTTAYLLAWCSMTVFLWAPGDIANHMFLVLVLACSLAGAIAVSAVHPAIALSMFVFHSLFIFGPTALSHDGTDRTLAELSVVFCLLLSGQAVALGISLNKMLKLEHERAGLVQNLQRAKGESDRERARAMTAGRAKSQFLSNMNHELRTPMNAILGFSELIKTKAFGDSADRYAEYAEIIYSSGQHLLALINDMLDLAKIESGRLGLRESELNLVTVIDEAVDSASAKAADAQLRITREIGRGIPPIHGDERSLRQIVSNLLSNAIKFTPPDGEVTVFARIESDGRAAFGVADTGIGIAPEDQAHVFERFGKGRHDVTTAEKGTGLGLAIVKGFAEAHDGSVVLESMLGAGTRVTVYLPASRVMTAAQAPAQRKAG